MRAAIVISASTGEDQARELISAAKAAGADEINLWVFREDAERFASLPAHTLLAIKAAGALIAERYLPALVTLYNRFKPFVVLLSSNFFGDELAVRLGCKVDGSAASGIIRISTEENNLRIVRRVYGMHLEGEFLYSKPPYIFSVVRDSYLADYSAGSPEFTWSDIKLPEVNWQTDCVETASEKVKNLDAFPLVLVGGRGIGAKANMDELVQLAEKLGAGIGATRPVVYNGWLSLNHMVGLSGTIIKPKVCITFGSSGSIPLIKGVEKSELLAAINSDPDAPIFNYCDIGIVDDCVAAIPELEKLAKKPTEKNG